MPICEEILAARPARSTGHVALVLAFVKCDFAAVEAALDNHDIDLNSQSFLCYTHWEERIAAPLNAYDIMTAVLMHVKGKLSIEETEPDYLDDDDGV